VGRCSGGRGDVFSNKIKSPRLQSDLNGDIEKFVGVVRSSRTSSGCGDLQIVKELHRRFIFLFCLRDEYGLLGPFGDFMSATNNVRLAMGDAAAVARRRHGVDVENEGNLKDFDVIFIFVKMFCTVCYFF
jgi:hypothetical protein